MLDDGRDVQAREQEERRGKIQPHAPPAEKRQGGGAEGDGEAHGRPRAGPGPQPREQPGPAQAEGAQQPQVRPERRAANRIAGEQGLHHVGVDLNARHVGRRAATEHRRREGRGVLVLKPERGGTDQDDAALELIQVGAVFPGDRLQHLDQAGVLEVVRRPGVVDQPAVGPIVEPGGGLAHHVRLQDRHVEAGELPGQARVGQVDRVVRHEAVNGAVGVVREVHEPGGRGLAKRLHRQQQVLALILAASHGLEVGRHHHLAGVPAQGGIEGRVGGGGLPLREHDVERHDGGAGLDEPVDQVGIDGARRGPGAEVFEGGLVDAHDRHVGGSGQRAAGLEQAVVEDPLRPHQEAAQAQRAPEEREQQAQQQRESRKAGGGHRMRPGRRHDEAEKAHPFFYTRPSSQRPVAASDAATRVNFRYRASSKNRHGYSIYKE
ncbi:hypothetical protein D3C72_634350 [compost metagenome]